MPKPHEILQAMADDYKQQLHALQSKFTIRHYRNSCAMMGIFSNMAGILNCELLVGKASDVNCPYCKPKRKSK